jgi:hypothetical protein
MATRQVAPDPTPLRADRVRLGTRNRSARRSSREVRHVRARATRAVRYAGPGGAATAVALSALDAALETPSATLLILDDVEVAGPRVADALLASFEIFMPQRLVREVELPRAYAVNSEVRRAMRVSPEKCAVDRAHSARAG